MHLRDRYPGAERARRAADPRRDRQDPAALSGGVVPPDQLQPAELVSADSEMAQLVRANAQAVAGIDPAPIISLGGTDARLWRYKDLPAIVYGPSPTGMGSFDEHVTIEEFLHVVQCHVLSAYDYLARPG